MPEVPEVPEVPEAPAPEEPSEPSEPVVIKRRGRPKGSLNKKTVEKMQVEREPSPPPALTLDVDFTSEAVLGETAPPPKRKPKTRAKPPPPPPTESGEDEPTPPRRSVSERKRPPPSISKGVRSTHPTISKFLHGASKSNEQSSMRRRWHSTTDFFNGKVNATPRRFKAIGASSTKTSGDS